MRINYIKYLLNKPYPGVSWIWNVEKTYDDRNVLVICQAKVVMENDKLILNMNGIINDKEYFKAKYFIKNKKLSIISKILNIEVLFNKTV